MLQCVMCPSFHIARAKGPANCVSRQSGTFKPAFVCPLCIVKSKTFNALLTGGTVIRVLSATSPDGTITVSASHQDTYAESTGATLEAALEGLCSGLDAAYKLASPVPLPPTPLPPTPPTATPLVPSQVFPPPLVPGAVSQPCRQVLSGSGLDRCGTPATHAILWPGSDEPSPTCERHLESARNIAAAMGFVLQCQPLDTMGG